MANLSLEEFIHALKVEKPDAGLLHNQLVATHAPYQEFNALYTPPAPEAAVAAGQLKFTSADGKPTANTTLNMPKAVADGHAVLTTDIAIASGSAKGTRLAKTAIVDRSQAVLGGLNGMLGTTEKVYGENGAALHEAVNPFHDKINELERSKVLTTAEATTARANLAAQTETVKANVESVKSQIQGEFDAVSAHAAKEGGINVERVSAAAAAGGATSKPGEIPAPGTNGRLAMTGQAAVAHYDKSTMLDKIKMRATANYKQARGLEFAARTAGTAVLAVVAGNRLYSAAKGTHKDEAGNEVADTTSDTISKVGQATAALVGVAATVLVGGKNRATHGTFSRA